MYGFSLSALRHGLRWQDGVDIAVLTLLFSSAYRGLRHTVVVPVAIGVLLLAAASYVANRVGLILTSYLLSAVSAVAAIAVVVVFQQEIRRGLARINPLGRRRRPRNGAGAGDAGAIVARAAFAVAGRGRGALIVLPRRDPLVDHVTAGTPVDARLSAAMIEAIFTSTSPLHDGAAVVSGDRITRAGVVLPLATDTDDPEHGTRHRAAVGLAHLTDALVVCVSEERRAVCLAHGDELVEMPDEPRLRDALTRLDAGAPLWARGSERRRRARPGVLPYLLPYLAIFAGVVAAWAALALDRSQAIARVLPLEIRGLGYGMVFDPPRYTSVAVELRGSRRELELLPRDAVAAFVDLGGAGAGARVYRVQTSAPPGIDVTNATPPVVQIQVHPRDTLSAARPAAPPIDGRARVSPRR